MYIFVYVCNVDIGNVYIYIHYMKDIMKLAIYIYIYIYINGTNYLPKLISACMYNVFINMVYVVH